ncbi:MAG: hypothetical protein KBD43_14875 [Saprospiraceae bacterium]|nr:hypothetical protein [Saprospiraceae bacterium]
MMKIRTWYFLSLIIVGSIFVWSNNFVYAKTMPEIITVKESHDEQFLYLLPGYNIPTWNYNRMALLEKVYSENKDTFDFLIVFPLKRLESNSAMIINSNVKGIGLSEVHLSANTTNLKALVTMDMYNTFDSLKQFNALNTNTLIDSFSRVAVHEIGHYWCCYVNWPVMTGDHYSTVVDLFNKNTTYSDPLGYSRWVQSSTGNLACVDHNRSDAIFKFSNLTLYLMGLIPKDKVDIINYYNYVKSPQFSYIGPYCDEKVEWLNSQKFSIDDLLKIAGERLPEYTESQKMFNVGYVILTDKDTASVPEDFLELIRLFNEKLIMDWKSSTNSLSTLVNEATPPPTNTLSITPQRVTVNSNQSVEINVTVPNNTLRTSLYVTCPKGATVNWRKDVQNGLRRSIPVCNRWINLDDQGVATLSLYVSNTTEQMLKVIPNFYAYYSDNPNYANGVSSEISVNPQRKKSPSQMLPTKIKSNESSLSPFEATTLKYPPISTIEYSRSDIHIAAVIKSLINIFSNQTKSK